MESFKFNEQPTPLAAQEDFLESGAPRTFHDEQMAAFKAVLERFAESPGKAGRALALAAAVTGAAAENAYADSISPYDFEDLATLQQSYGEDAEATDIFADLNTRIDTSFDESQTYEGYISNLNEAFANASDYEKLYAGSRIGSELARHYDYDMYIRNINLQPGGFVAFTNEEIFEALKNGDDVGICGNIAAAQANIMNEMGLETVTVAGLNSSDSGHTYNMVEVEGPDGEKQIAILNYGEVHLTGQTDFADAISVYQEKLQTARVFGNQVDASDGRVSHMDTPASETFSGLTGFSTAADKIEELKEPVAKYKLTYEEGLQTVELSEGAVFFRYAKHQAGDDINPITRGEAITAGLSFSKVNERGATFNAELSGSYANVFYGESALPTEYIAAEIAAAYQGPRQNLMTNEEFGQLHGQFAAAARIAGSMIMDPDVYIGDRAPDGGGEVAAEYTLVYDPNDTHSFYLTLGAQGRLGVGDLQSLAVTLQPEQYVKIGWDVKMANQAQFGIDASYTDGIHQDDLNIGARLAQGSIEIEVAYGKTSGLFANKEDVSSRISYAAGGDGQMSLERAGGTTKLLFRKDF